MPIQLEFLVHAVGVSSTVLRPTHTYVQYSCLWTCDGDRGRLLFYTCVMVKGNLCNVWVNPFLSYMLNCAANNLKCVIQCAIALACAKFDTNLIHSSINKNVILQQACICTVMQDKWVLIKHQQCSSCHCQDNASCFKVTTASQGPHTIVYKTYSSSINSNYFSVWC